MTAPLKKYDPSQVTAFTTEEAALLAKSNQTLTGPMPGIDPSRDRSVLDAYNSGDWTASYLGQNADQVARLEREAIDLAKPDAEALARDRQRADEQTRVLYGQSREELRNQQDIGNRQITQAAERLGGVVTLRKNIEDFKENVKTFDMKVSNALERLTIEEQNAYDSHDAAYYKELKAQRIEYNQMQTNFFKDQHQYLMDSFNMMLKGEEFKRQGQAQAFDQLQFFAENGSLGDIGPEALAALAQKTGIDPNLIYQAGKNGAAEEKLKRSLLQAQTARAWSLANGTGSEGFRDTQIMNGVANSGLAKQDFEKLDYNTQVFFIQRGTEAIKDKLYIDNLIDAQGKNLEDVQDWIDGTDVPDGVKSYFKNYASGQYGAEQDSTSFFERISGFFGEAQDFIGRTTFGPGYPDGSMPEPTPTGAFPTSEPVPTEEEFTF